MSVKTDAELTSLNNSRLPDNSVRFISAEKVRNQVQDIIDSKVNIADFKGTLSNPIIEQYWIDSADVVWRVTMGTDGVLQSESI